jgi:hypothetical protein
MDGTDRNRGSDDRATFSSAFRASLAELRTELAEEEGVGDREDRLNQLLEAFTSAAWLGGIAPEPALITLRQEWERAGTSPVLMYSRLSRDEQRLEAINTFAAAYFSGSDDDSSGGQ